MKKFAHPCVWVSPPTGTQTELQHHWAEHVPMRTEEMEKGIGTHQSHPPNLWISNWASVKSMRRLVYFFNLIFVLFLACPEWLSERPHQHMSTCPWCPWCPSCLRVFLQQPSSLHLRGRHEAAAFVLLYAVAAVRHAVLHHPLLSLRLSTLFRDVPNRLLLHVHSLQQGQNIFHLHDS